VCLYIWPQYAPWYISYVVMFNMLVGPVFSAGSVTSERERETLDLLLTTIITPWKILWGKLIAGLRVSSVLTLFLVWPVLLACVMVSLYWTNLLAVGAYLAIVLITCLTTAMLALFFSVVFKKTSHAMMTTYLVIIVLFCAPLAANFFAQTFYANHPNAPYVAQAGLVSPFSAAFSVPLDISQVTSETTTGVPPAQATWSLFVSYVAFSLGLDAALVLVMMWLFNTRWRVAG
jgi:ABC-type transport system involved in multi-copper enzyme maturation permease subunit